MQVNRFCPQIQTSGDRKVLIPLNQSQNLEELEVRELPPQLRSILKEANQAWMAKVLSLGYRLSNWLLEEEQKPHLPPELERMAKGFAQAD